MYTNIAISFRGSALEWYIFEFNDFDRNALNNDPGIKNWINILSRHFKVPTNITLGLLTNVTYSLDNVYTWQPPVQYICTIMQHDIGCNIVNVANQLLFAYQGLAPELRVFVSPLIELTKAVDFICALKEKQEVWHKIITALVGPQ